MTDTQIQCFLTAAKCENFTKAATQLFVTQPVLGRHIANLEDEIGFPLFLRDRKSVRLTPYGKLLREYFIDCQRSFTEVKQKMAAHRRLENNELILGTVEGQNVGEIYSGAFKTLLTEHPEIKLTIRYFTNKELVNMLVMGVIDVAITAIFEFERRGDVELFEYMPLLKMDAGIVVPSDHPALKKNYVALTDFSDDCFISLNDYDSDEDSKANVHLMQLIGATRQLKADNIETLGIMVESGLGIAALNSGHKLASNPRFRFLTFPELRKVTDSLLWLTGSSNPCIRELTQAMNANGFIVSD